MVLEPGDTEITVTGTVMSPHMTLAFPDSVSHDCGETSPPYAAPSTLTLLVSQFYFLQHLFPTRLGGITSTKRNNEDDMLIGFWYFAAFPFSSALLQSFSFFSSPSVPIPPPMSIHSI